MHIQRLPEGTKIMRNQSKWCGGMVALAAMVGAVTTGPAAAVEERVAMSAGIGRPAEKVSLLAGGNTGSPSYVGSAGTDAGQATPSRGAPLAKIAPTATFDITYHGFSRAARAAFRAAADTWATKVSSPIPITVDATLRPLGRDVLGSGGPGFSWRDFDGAPRANTWYFDAMANKLAGRQIDASADIVATFNSDLGRWYFGTNGATPAGRYDFESVVMHELGHGLGILGSGSMTPQGSTARSSNLPASYDLFTENASGTPLLKFVNNSTRLTAQLTSNRVFFDSPRVRNANHGKPAKLYAPAQWQQGSSYGHLDEAAYPKGNPNSLMTPTLHPGEAIHSPGPITRALLHSIGW